MARFAKQVRKAPEQLAVRSASSQWTYRELDERSNRIAQGILRCSAPRKSNTSPCSWSTMLR